MTPTISRNSTRNSIPLRAAIVALSIHTVVAAGGVWTNPAGGSWATPANWNGATIADGTDSLANFSTLDIAANAVVTLDGARSIGFLSFADATTPSNDWSLTPGTGGPLTLATSVGTPAIGVASQTATVGVPLAGVQGFIKSGAGALVLSGANTFTGPLSVTGGILRAGNGDALGAPGTDNETIASSGGTFDVNGTALNVTEIVRISGSGVGGAGALVNNGAAQQNALNRVVLTGNATAGGAARFDIRPGTAPTLDLAGFTLTKTGTNQLSLVGTAITPGNVVINQGIFSVETTSTANTSGSITVNSGGTLGVYGNAMDVTIPATPVPMFMRPIVSNNGTINNLGSDANIGGTVAIATGTTLNLTGFNTTHMRGVISGTGNVLKTGGGTYSMVVNNTYVGKTTATSGYFGLLGEGVFGPAPATFQADQLTLDNAGIWTVAGGFYVPNGGPNFTGTRGITLGAGGGYFDAYGGANSRGRIGAGSVISGPGKLIKNGGGYMDVSAANTYEGGTQINGGPDTADTIPNAAINLSNYAGFGTGPITFGNTGAMNGIRFLATGTLPNNITLSSAIGGNTRFVVEGGSTATIGGLIEGGDFNGGQFQVGGSTGTLIIPGDQTYTSDTVVNGGGRLLVDGQILASDFIVKTTGALGGSGTVRLLTLEEGSSIIASTPPLNATLGVYADKTDKGVSIIVPGGSATPGLKTVDVVSYGDDVEGLAPVIENFNTAAYRGASVADDTVNNKITMSYTSSVLTWNGVGPVWDAATTASFLEGDGKFYQGDAVNFTDPAAASTVTLTGQLLPSAITVTNTTNPYTFSNTGSILTGSLTKNGTGMLVITGANSYAGGTTINGGTISLSLSAAASGGGSPGGLGTGSVTVNTGGLLKLWINNGATTYYNFPITLDGGRILGEDGINVLKGGVTLAAGGGTLSPKWNNKNIVVDSVMSGPGKLTVFRETPGGEAGTAVILNQANTYLGGTDLFSGVLRAAYSDQALGSGPLTFTGSATFGTAATGSDRTIANDIAITTGVTASFDSASFPLTLNGSISGPGILTMASGGTVALGGNNSYEGGTNFNSTGNLRVDSPGALGTTGTLSFGGGFLMHSAGNTTDYSARFSTAVNQAYKVNTNGQNITWAAPLTSVGGSITKTGAGTLLLTGASTYNGGTNAQGGVIETALISDTGATPLGTFATAGGSFLSFSGGTFRYSGADSVTTARYLWNDQTSGTFDVTNAAATVTFSATAGSTINKPFAKTGAGGLVLSLPITGAATTVTVTGGALTLNGTNTYTGDTSVAAASLTLGTASLANAADLRLGTGGTVTLTHAGTDVIDEFYIDGVAQAAGTWGSPTSAATHKTARITGTGLLSVTTGGSAGGPTYEAWASTAGLTALNNGKTVDADFDGLDNITEFALDGAPLSGIRGGKIVSKIATAGSEQALVLTLPVRTGATFTGDNTAKTSAAIAGVIYSIQGSATLDGFPLEVLEVTGTDAAAIQTDMPDLSTGWTYRTFRVAGPVTGADKKFIRAVITEG
ncbi:beta strand repeat-containing protein [Luteolibacter sp. Populi]|uniref:beta strand repeat-containing protein n=1 Tax=Luteolibacter sp. Populi TaxID=3230487 RepID=UPI00346539BE